MAAAYEPAVVAVVEPEGEASAWDTVGGLQSRCKGNSSHILEEQTKERWIEMVVGAEAAAEASVGDEAEPALADEGGARERGGFRGQAEEDLGEEIFVFQRPRRRRSAAAADGKKIICDRLSQLTSGLRIHTF